MGIREKARTNIWFYLTGFEALIAGLRPQVAVPCCIMAAVCIARYVTAWIEDRER